MGQSRLGVLSMLSKKRPRPREVVLQTAQQNDIGEPMNDKETAVLQDQIVAILALMEELRSALQVQSTVIQEHLQAHKENQ